MSIKHYTVEQLKEAVRNSKNIKQVATALGYSDKIGATGQRLKFRIKDLGISTAHFTKREYVGNKKSTIDYLTIDGPICRNLRHRLINEKLLPYICKNCGLEPFWNGVELLLELDHISGFNNDNRLENLRFLCPNCHTQTPTYRSKNPKFVENKKLARERSRTCCLVCEKEIKPKRKRCYECDCKFKKFRKEGWPSDELLVEWANELGFQGLADKLGEDYGRVYGKLRKRNLLSKITNKRNNKNNATSI